MNDLNGLIDNENLEADIAEYYQLYIKRSLSGHTIEPPDEAQAGHLWESLNLVYELYESYGVLGALYAIEERTVEEQRDVYHVAEIDTLPLSVQVTNRLLDFTALIILDGCTNQERQAIALELARNVSMSHAVAFFTDGQHERYAQRVHAIGKHLNIKPESLKLHVDTDFVDLEDVHKVHQLLVAIKHLNVNLMIIDLTNRESLSNSSIANLVKLARLTRYMTETRLFLILPESIDFSEKQPLIETAGTLIELKHSQDTIKTRFTQFSKEILPDLHFRIEEVQLDETSKSRIAVACLPK